MRIYFAFAYGTLLGFGGPIGMEDMAANTSSILFAQPDSGAPPPLDDCGASNCDQSVPCSDCGMVCSPSIIKPSIRVQKPRLQKARFFQDSLATLTLSLDSPTKPPRI